MSETTVYELAYLLRVGESDAALKKVLTATKVSIVKEQPASQIQLAYPIKKQGVALFGYVHLTTESASALQEISDALQLENSVLRFITIKVPAGQKARASAERAAKRASASEEEKKPTQAVPGADRLSGLSNEKLSQTLEEILK